MFTPKVNCVFSSGVYALLMAADTPLERVLAEAHRRHWKEADLCRRLGISQQRLNNWKSRGLPADAAIQAAQRLHLSLDYIVFGKPIAQSSGHSTSEPLALYTITPDRQKRLLDLFDQLLPAQQDQILDEIAAAAKANLAIAQHFADKRLRTTDNERIEATYGRPSPSTKKGT